MCRFLAYAGSPIFLDTFIYSSSHSLVHQSLHATEAKTVTNGDGFGIGWYGEREEPGLYREILPAWSDDNLKSLTSQIRSRLHFGHVRASTGTALSRSNCHPFKFEHMLFMHNGQIGGFHQIKREIEQLLPGALYDARSGATDSELIFLLALSHGLKEQPITAMTTTLECLREMMARAGISAPLRFTSCFTDGDGLWAYRWASDEHAPSLYFRRSHDGVIVVSEPVDGGEEDNWHPVPQSSCLFVKDGQIEVRPLAMH
ncbi:MAG: class II glutamine amidotransferase [Novosphingobium sp.]